MFPITIIECDWFQTLTYIKGFEVARRQWNFILGDVYWDCAGEDFQASVIAFIRDLYEKKIGEIASKWPNGTCRHAVVKLGDLFDYYATKEGILKPPAWKTFEYAVEDYLTNDPRLKFHPNRVMKFIQENGLDQLENMK